MPSGYESLKKAQALRDAGKDEAALGECLKSLALDASAAGAWDLRSMLEQKLGMKEAAWESLQKSLALGEPSADRHHTAARLLQSLGNLDGALEHGQKAAALAPARAEFQELLASLQEGGKALESLEAALKLSPSPELHLKAADLAAADDRLDEAIAHAREANAPQTLWKYLLARGLRSEALKEAKAAAKTLPLESAAFCRDLGEFEEAFAILKAALKNNPKASFELARLRLWHGETKAAASAAPKDPYIQGVAAALEGKFKEALAALEKAPAELEAKIWKAEVLRKLGRAEDARRALDAACKDLPPEGRPLSALINGRLLGDAAHDDLLSGKIAWRQLGLPRTTPEEMPGQLEFALDCMLGNRSSPHTVVWEDSKGKKNRPIHFNPRVTTMGLQASLRFGDPDRVLAEFDALLEKDPRGPYLHESRGEVCLWLGRLDEAETFIKRGLELNPLLPWPNIGLCGIEVLRGNLQGGLDYLRLADANMAPKRVLAVWRAEIFRKMGDPVRALKELDLASEVPPFRLPIWLNRALALGAAGDAEGLRQTYDMLTRHAGPFLEAAAAEAKSKEPVKVLETALAMMKGNRSSWLHAYVTRDGRVVHVKLRGVRPETVPPGLRHHRWLFSEAP